MDQKRIEELAKNPMFISGIYNYCDQWCERCAFTARCMNCAMSERESDSGESKGMQKQAFWDKVHGPFAVTREMVVEKTQELGIDLDAVGAREATEETRRVHEAAQEQPILTPLAALKAPLRQGQAAFPNARAFPCPGLIDGQLAWRQHASGHTTAPNWPTFVTRSARYINAPPQDEGGA